MTQRSPDVLIVGGGHAGLWLGLALVRAGFLVRLVDPDPPERALDRGSDGRSLALLGGSRLVGDRLGVWPAGADPEPVRHVEVLDSASASRVVYDAAGVKGGVLAWGVENRALRAALTAAFVETAGRDAWVQGRLAAIERPGGGIMAILADGPPIGAKLLVGADGRGSPVRHMCRIPLDRRAYGQAAIACIVSHERPHGATVRERLRPAGPLALLPLTGDRCGVTWVEPEDKARAIGALPPDQLIQRLHREIGGALGRLQLASPVAVWPLGAQHARRYVAPRTALIGDAAHGVHPIHAQGLNMGIADIGALVDLLVGAARSGRDPGSPDLLLAYQRARWWDNERRLRLTDGLNRLFSNDIAPARLLRSAILKAVDALPPLKSLAVREGMRAG
jgi:2-octaprenyl-6-methoxyphenol hydroxylase